MYYPDTATFIHLSGGGIDQATGYPIAPTEKTVSLKGRYEVSNTDALVNVVTGESFTPSFYFYMPKGQPNVDVGSNLKVYDESSETYYTGKVQQFNKGKFNAYCVCSNT